MVARRALVLVGGKPRQLPVGDTLEGTGDAAADPTEVSMTYDAQGRVATVTADAMTKTMTYDAHGRIATVAWGARTETYTYDASGRFTGMKATEE
ncbi:hypothetical protein [Comamonas sp.]|uniref:hypothetical protein n=1 Tax=Comamonas sp. TaxID=34028 RepID=UPI002588DC3E|nr:hypothetical protein [Comamonas sp.]